MRMKAVGLENRWRPGPSAPSRGSTPKPRLWAAAATLKRSICWRGSTITNDGLTDSSDSHRRRMTRPRPDDPIGEMKL